MGSRVFISIGSNLGDRTDNCRKAIEDVQRSGRVSIIRESSFYETEPWGGVVQPPFVNCVVELSTDLPPEELLGFLKAVEFKRGRDLSNEERWGPRVIDLDIIFYGESVISQKGLVIPHPHAHERAFVLAPLCEIAPDFIHPVLKERVSGLLLAVEGKGGVRRLEGKQP
ncbi:MAG: 2-amino-4-hydroxy-6-hydroxymethyldihydropteridine diphosphokinase [Deltaproteobacteria bacterium]|nr:2-amino-4-hydroxy-6-hydroxymethyldihydropteridine diphosphokinase [Deltaproteobacteria bacterium]MBI5810822.1 2-amino-4-hydroxy-6-hydroxymethyldihydropteridine diphosphokinase [Deltaproteobacteria bacterium]